MLRTEDHLLAGSNPHRNLTHRSGWMVMRLLVDHSPQKRALRHLQPISINTPGMNLMAFRGAI